MQEPDLKKMWRTWIRIERGKNSVFKSFQDTIREKIQPFLQLEKNGEISWFYFLCHDKENPPDPANLYFEVRFTTDRKNPKEFLREYCVDTDRYSPGTTIPGIDEKLLEGGDIRKAWRIIGEQSEFIINFVCSYKKEIEIPPKQIAQFMHFIMNPLRYGQKSLFFPKATDEKMEYILEHPVRNPGITQIASVLGDEWWLF